MPRWDENGRLIEDAAPVRRWDANGNPVQEPRRRGQSGTWQEEVGGALANINRGIPFAQDLVGLGNRVRGAISDATGGGFRGEDERLEQREFQQDFRNRRPNAGAFAEGFGNVVPMIATAGASTAPTVATRGVAALTTPAPQAAGGLPLFAQQTTRALSGAPVGATTRGLPLYLGQTRNAALIGGVTGGVYGGATGDAPNMNMVDRAGATNLATGLGFGLGAATPAAVNAASATWRAAEQPVSRLLNNMPRLAPRANAGVGSMGGQMFAGGSATPPAAPPPSGPRIPRAAMGTIDRMANNARMTPDAVEAALAEARRNPQGQVLVDVFGDTGIRRIRPIVQGPGQTGNRAVEVARNRAQEQPDRILNELNTRLAVAETPQQALRSLERQYGEASANLYNPLFQRPMDPELRQTAAEFLRRYDNTPGYRDAARRAQEIFDLDVANELATGSLDDNFARYMHYLKMGVDDMVRDAPRAGIQATQRRGLREMQRRIVAAIDRSVPGYREARNQWSTLSSAEDALDDGRELITQSAGDIRVRMGEMTDFERYHARVGFADAVAQRIGLRGSVNGNRNVAEALGSPEMQRRVAAMFDSPEEAASFLDTLNQQNMLMRNAAGWGGNSSTFSNAAYGADEAMNTVADMGLELARGSPTGAARRGIQDVYNAARGGALERANNQRGEAVFTRIDQGDSEDFARAVVAELRRRDAARRTATAASQTGAAAAGTQQGN